MIKEKDVAILYDTSRLLITSLVCVVAKVLVVSAHAPLVAAAESYTDWFDEARPHIVRLCPASQQFSPLMQMRRWA